MELNNAIVKKAASITISELVDGAQTVTVLDANNDTLEVFEYAKLIQPMTEESFLASTGIAYGISAWILPTE